MRKETGPSKKQIIVEYFRAKGYQKAGVEEMREIGRELQRRLGIRNRTAFSYIARVLAEAGVPVWDAGGRVAIDEPYASRLKDALHFHDLPDAADSLRNLDAAYRDYLAAGDRTGMSLVRAIVLKGKQRAAQIASNPKVREAKRREKGEIVNWFTVWLQTPDIFFDWLDIRKRSEEFQEMFGGGSGGRESG